jgi:hypothetical protein
LARDHDAHRKRFAGRLSVELIVPVTYAAAFELRREDSAVWDALAKDARKRRRIALAKARKIWEMFEVMPCPPAGAKPRCD